MNSVPKTKPSFFKEHVLPVLLVFLIPGFSAWFFAYAEGRMDADFLRSIEQGIRADRSLPAARKAELLAFYRAVPVSKIMASNESEAVELQANFGLVKTRYAVFRWMKRIAWICLGTVAGTFLIVGLSVAFSFRSQAAQYRALRIGWPVLRTSAAIQVLGQAALAVALSFWVTAIFAEAYYIKLVLVIGLLALIAVVALWKAIFTKVDNRCEVVGHAVSDSDAPALWQRVRSMASRLNTSAPDRIIVGIEPSFFVTEHPVIFGGSVQKGRTLYLSLPMLKVLSMEEADAVLGHELAHFSGQDTLWSRKISPLTGKFALYLRMLANGLTLIVAHFMHLFWKLYGLSIHKLSRAREFRADQVGSELVSKDAMKRALLKTTGYCEFRNETENGILSQKKIDQSLQLSRRLEQGFPEFLRSFAANDRSIDERVPHPFDTHPTLNNRLTHLGFDAQEALRDPAIHGVVQTSWFHTIASASALEEQMWTEQQRALQTFHSQDLAWRLVPSNEEELAIVLEHFPHADFRNKDGEVATLDFDRIHVAEWPEPIFFKSISKASMEDAFRGKWLTIEHVVSGNAKSSKTKFYPAHFTGEKGDLLTLFGVYYSRHMNSRGATTA